MFNAGPQRFAAFVYLLLAVATANSSVAGSGADSDECGAASARIDSLLGVCEPDQLTERFLRMLDDPTLDLCVEEPRIDRKGYQYLWGGRPELAVAIFELNTVLYPESAGAHASLADGYVHCLDRGKAVASYDRSLALEPSGEVSWSRSTVDKMVANLGGQTSATSSFAPGAQTGRSGDYLEFEPPGRKGEVFAPGIISLGNSFENAICFDAATGSYYLNRQGPAGGYLVGRRTEDGWTAPGPYPGKEAVFETTISPDGGRMFYCADMEVRYRDRTEDGWGDEVTIGPGMYATATLAGTVYYTEVSESAPASIVRRRRTADGFSAPESISQTMDGPPVGAHPCIAPDESYLLFDRFGEDDPSNDSDIYVCFRRPDGRWGQAVRLGPEVNTDGDELCVSHSPCGKYLFYTSCWDIRWISVGVLDLYR